jgi:hypothetical protein
VWSTRHELIGQVRDAGHITSPRPPRSSRAPSGTGYGSSARSATGYRSAPGRTGPSSRSACA